MVFLYIIVLNIITTYQILQSHVASNCVNSYLVYVCIFEYILSLSTAVVQICRFIPLVNPINYSTKHFLIDFIVNGTFLLSFLPNTSLSRGFKDDPVQG